MVRPRLLIAALCLQGLHSIPSGAVQPPVYQLGLYLPGEGYFGASMKSAFETGAASMKQRTGLDVKFQLFTTLDSYMEAVEQGKIDAVFSISEVVFLRHQDKGYDPYAGYQIFGRANQQYCLYVPAASAAKSVKDIKGKAGLTYEDEWSYILLADLVGEPPERFFSSLSISPGGASTAYALSLSQTGAGLINSQAVDLMKSANPGPLKKIRRLACGPWYPTAPILVSKKVPATHRAAIRKELLSIHTEKAYKTLSPILKRLRFSYTGLDPKGLAAMRKRYHEGKKTGLIILYHTWEKNAVRRK